MKEKKLNEAFAEKPRQERDDLVMLNELEGKVARVLWPGIDVRHECTPEARELVRKSIVRLKQIFREEFKREAFDEFCKKHDLKPGDIVECKNYGTVQFVDINGSYMPWVVTRKVDGTGYISQNKKTRPLKQFEDCKVVGHKDLEA